MWNGKLALTIAPRHQVGRDFQANCVPILLALAALAVYIVIASIIISFLEGWTLLHAAYFTVINVTTVGFGDVTAATHPGKVLSGINAFAGLIAFGILVALISLAFQPGEFTGTATPITAPSEQPASGSAPDQQQAESAVADLLKTLHGLLRMAHGAEHGFVHIVVRDDRNEPRLHVEIFVQPRSDR